MHFGRWLCVLNGCYKGARELSCNPRTASQRQEDLRLASLSIQLGNSSVKDPVSQNTNKQKTTTTLFNAV